MRPQQSSYDLPILRFVAYNRIATTHQVVHAFFINAGRSPRHGFDVIGSLVERGLMTSEPLDASAGRRSRQIVTATRAGLRIAGVKNPTRARLHLHWRQRNFFLQLTEMLLVRELEGWQLYYDSVAWRLTKDWMIEPYRGRILTADERQIRSMIEKAREPEVVTPVLFHRGESGLRFVVGVHPRRAVKRALGDMPIIFPRQIGIELVCGDLERLNTSLETIRSWCRRRKLTATVFRVPHFRRRIHPAKVRVPTQDRYSPVGLLPPEQRWSKGPLYSKLPNAREPRPTGGRTPIVVCAPDLA